MPNDAPPKKIARQKPRRSSAGAIKPVVKTAPRPAAPPGPAAMAYARLVAAIQRFEAGLDPSHEIAMGFAGGEAGVLRIEGLGFQDPDLITFWGRDDDGLKTQLIQHIAQLSVILRAVPVKGDPPRRIGFRLEAGWLGGEAGDPSV